MTSANLLKFVLTLCICSSVFGQDPELVERAEAGDADAQLNLGYMYDHGDGVPENDVEAVKWFRLAADQGHATAQTNLGYAYFFGNGVPKDDVESYARFNVAGALGSDVEKSKSNLTARMTKEDISAAQKRSKEIWESLESRKVE